MNQIIVKSILSLLVWLLIAGCAIGPDYKRPTSMQITDFKQQAGWRLANPDTSTLPNKWWVLYKDNELNKLQEQLLNSNQTLAQYEARYRQAIALVKGARAAYFPNVTANVKTKEHNKVRAAIFLKVMI